MGAVKSNDAEFAIEQDAADVLHRISTLGRTAAAFEWGELSDACGEAWEAVHEVYCQDELDGGADKFRCADDIVLDALECNADDEKLAGALDIAEQSQLLFWTSTLAV